MERTTNGELSKNGDVFIGMFLVQSISSQRVKTHCEQNPSDDPEDQRKDIVCSREVLTFSKKCGLNIWGSP
jgi:hypothetical protein